MDSSTGASVSGLAVLWDLSTGAARHVLEDAGYNSPVAFSPDGKTLATYGIGLRDGADNRHVSRTSLWSVATGKRLRSATSDGWWFIGQLVFSPDGKTLVEGGALGTMRWFNARNLALISEAVRAPHVQRKLAFSPDGHTLASIGNQHGETLLWDLNTGRLSKRLETQEPAMISVDLGYSGDGQSLAVANMYSPLTNAADTVTDSVDWPT